MSLTNSWKMSYPERFLPEVSKLPFISHDTQKNLIRADTPELKTFFQYEKIEEGCYLFVVDMEAVKDTQIHLCGDKELEYYNLSYQLIRGAVNKNPSRKESSANVKTMSLPRICSFYNNQFEYETSFEQYAGVRAFIFSFTKEWLHKNCCFDETDPQAPFMKVIDKEIESVAYFNDNFYRDTFDELNQLLYHEKRPPVYHLLVRKFALTLIADFFNIVSDPASVLNSPPQAEEFNGIEAIKTYIDKYFKKGFPGLSMLADVGKMSVATMRRQFKRQLGRSAFDYFREVQMRYAFDQLQRGAQVKQVALSLGYKNPANFSRNFKTVYRVLPVEIKRL